MDNRFSTEVVAISVGLQLVVSFVAAGSKRDELPDQKETSLVLDRFMIGDRRGK